MQKRLRMAAAMISDTAITGCVLSPLTTLLMIVSQLSVWQYWWSYDKMHQI
jgi:hypothetical protein